MARRLAILNEHPQHVPGPELLHELIRFESSPNNLALEYTDDEGICHTLTYEQLSTRSDALAARIVRTRGLEHSRREASFIVPIHIQQCLELYVAQIAVLKAGGAFCPMSLDIPEERLRFILQDTDASVLVTTSDRIDQLPDLEGIEVLSADNDGSSSKDFAPPSIRPSQAAYIMYTSGSTGLPKGVIISHGAATQALLAHERHVPQFRRFLQFASPTFDVSIAEIFFPLYRGATVVACDRRQLLNDLPEVIDRLKIDAAELTPSVASTLLRGRQSVPRLELLLTIGEMLKRSVVEEFATDSEQSGILCGMYGPTEATIHCTVQPCFQKTMSVRNIGMPLDTVSAFIVRPERDAHGAVPEVLAVGEEGELALGGKQLAEGYLNREEQTKAAFAYHPQYGRLYRTGDRARIDADGQLECLGRISSGQVKLRGQRIELGEIEYAAGKTPGCGSSVAEVLDNQLVVFCVRVDQSLTTAAVKQTCGEWLPKFMTPAKVRLLDALPYLASGKVDRKALAVLVNTSHQSTSRSKSDRLDRSRFTDQAVEIINKVCSVAIDETTDLSTVGVDSLSAIRIAAELRRLDHDRVDATMILDARSLEDLEQSVQQSIDDAVVDFDPTSARLAADIDSTLVRCRDEVEYVYPCTPVQAAMLTVTGRNPQAYCNTVTLEVKADRTPARVLAAFRTISQAHPMLRSGFVATTESQTGYATVTWRRLDADQATIVDSPHNSFTIVNSDDLLRPCRFEVCRRESQLYVLLHIHHALYDQWSIDVLKRDLSAALQGQAIVRNASFESVSTHYAPKLAESRKEQNEAFWQDQLRDLSISLLPSMNAQVVTPQLQQTVWHNLNINVEAARAKALKLGCSLPAVFQSAMAVILGLYCGTPDVTFGTVFSGRHLPLPNIEEVFGPCLVTLPCRVDTSTARTCTDLLRVLKNTNRDMQLHMDLPLAEIVQTTGCAPGTPLFDILFVWQETTVQTDPQKLCVVEKDSCDHHEFNLVLEFDPTSGLSVRATYQQSLITGDQVDILLRQLVQYASRMLEAPETPLANLRSCLDEHLLSISNPDPSYCADPQGLMAGFEQQAMRQPDATALVFATKMDKDSMSTDDLTYAELNKRANQFARFLRSSGVASGDLVCICMEKSLSLYTSILAVLKAGAGYVPLTPATPSARIRTIMQEANVKYSLCDGTSIEQFRSILSTKAFVVSEIELTDQAADDLQLPYRADDIAYTVFTSGSTGEPKGVSVAQQNLNGNLAALSDLYRAGPGDRLLQACSQAFDVSCFEILFAFTRGLCLCAASNTVLFEDLELSIRTFSITHLSLTPTVAALIDPANVPTVHFLVTAGEGVTDSVRQRWAGKGLLHQGYGPSETTNICSINMRMSSHDSLGNIGPPLRNTSVFVIAPARDFQILPMGSTGELAFGGEQVFRGYLGRDDLNATKLLDHPRFGRIYRSGDTGRILPDGSLLIAGRMDDQVKLRGNRIELGEINAVILRNQSVQDCTTLLCGGNGSDQMLVTFWVPETSTRRSKLDVAISESDTLTARLLYELLEDKLPDYMIPSVLLPVSYLPMTSQTKLDRRRLHALLSGVDAETRLRYSREKVVPDTDENWTVDEVVIAGVVAELMQIPRSTVGKSTSFLALGMNSLNAIAAARRLSKRLDCSVSLSTLMRHSSTRRLAAAVREEAQLPAPDHTTMLETTFGPAFVAQVTKNYAEHGHTISAILPCTPLQDAMLLSIDGETNSSYHNTTTYRINGDVQRLKQCWQQLIVRHAILRTSFVRTESSQHPFAQVVTTSTDLPWYDRPIPNRNDLHVDATSFGAPKDLSLARPLRMDLQDCVLTVHMHHALYDGISMSILTDELQQIYKGERLPSAVPFEPYLALAAKHSRPDAIDAWAKLLSGFEPKPFPRSEDTKDNKGSTTRSKPISRSVTDIDAFCKRYAVTTLSILQAAWSKVVSQAQDTSDICFGNVVSGRSIRLPGVERIVAPCFNTVPVRINVAQHSSNVRLIQALHKQNLSTMEYQLAPLRRLQALSSRPQHYIFDSLLLFQPPDHDLDQSIWQKIDEEGAMDLPVVVEVSPIRDTYTAKVHFLHTHITEDLAQTLLHAFVESFESCIHYPAGMVSDLNGTSKCKGELKPVVDSLVHNRPNEVPSEADEAVWTADMLLVRDSFAKLANVDVQRVTQHTSMYQLGLDSLNAAQVAYSVRKSGLLVNAADVLQGLTPAAIVRLACREGGSRGEAAHAIDLRSFDKESRQELASTGPWQITDVQSIRPCTPAQHGMLAQSQHSKGQLYVNHLLYCLPPSSKDSEVINAWLAVQRKHQALRTGFWQTDNAAEPYIALVWNAAAVINLVSNIGSLSDVAKLESMTSRTIVSELHRPVWRVHIGKYKANRAMVLSIHHALYDAEGLRYLIADFEAALRGEHIGAEISIDHLLLSSLGFELPTSHESTDFWQTTLRDLGQAFPYAHIHDGY